MNFDGICRSCLSQEERMTSLYEIYEHDLTLAAILQSCLHSKKEFSKDDGLPKQLCDNCVLVLTQFYNFSIVYEDSEQQLRAALKNNATAIEEINPKVELFEQSLSPETLSLEDVDVETLNQEQITKVEAEEENFYGFQPVASVQELQPSTIVKLKSEDTSCYDVYVELEDQNEVFIPQNDHQMEVAPVEVSLHQSSPRIDLFAAEYQPVPPSFETIKKYECSLCGEAHLYAVSFQHHMRLKHNLTSVNCEDYATEVHIQSYNDEDDEEQHKWTLPPTIYKCKYCIRQFSDEAQLHQHLKCHDIQKKYVCDVCGSRFIRKSYLDDHLEGHSSEKKYECKFCGKKFRRRTVLRAHKRLHTHPNYYVCELCGRAFTNASTLKTHNLLIHLKERNFKCLICNQSFPLKSTLTKHVLRHQKRESGEKGFDCSLCDMEYKDKSSLKRHIDSRHLNKVQLVACPDCPKKYASKANLMKHRRKNHSLNV